MARKRRSPAQLHEPPRVPRGRGTAAAVPSALALASAEAAEAAVSEADLERQYHYVRRDLVRIAILGTLMFLVIYVSTLFLM